MKVTDLIINYFTGLFALLNEMSPYLLLGFLFAGVLHVFVRKRRVIKYLGKNDMAAVIRSSLFGIPLPLCSCGVIPTGISFYKNGASKSSTISFLISTPQTGIDSILATYSLLGLPFAIIRPVVALLSGILGGGLSIFAFKNEKHPQHIHNSYNLQGNKILLMIKYAFIDFVKDIAKW